MLIYSLSGLGLHINDFFTFEDEGHIQGKTPSLPVTPQEGTTGVQSRAGPPGEELKRTK